ncbi:hypothetical protein BGZ54_006462 [Gamsiella multidivaricata]|nr:hypothetical protein BGZ54_006462 [Gamsiella multidivaricata]
MNSERPTVLISTGSAAGSLAEVSGTSVTKGSQRACLSALPSPPLSPQQNQDVFANLLRTNPYSMFESASDPAAAYKCPEDDAKDDESDHGYPYHQQWALQEREDQPSQTSMSIALTSRDTNVPDIIIPTREWIQMHSRISSLETEIAYVTRTNQLLNQELDKVNGYVQKLTSQDGEGWKREYEFLVQQVDLMHRQLQFAYSQMGHDQSNGVAGLQERQSRVEAEAQPDVTRQLREEVKELTGSLKNWQVALHKAEENYRRKCEGERVLKQTLREREMQLSGLVEKMNGYDSEFHKSITNYDELLRLSSRLRVLEEKQSMTAGSISSSTPSVDGSAADLTDDHMPGVFPEKLTQPSEAINVSQLSVSMLSWAALLASYMLS